MLQFLQAVTCHSDVWVPTCVCKTASKPALRDAQLAVAPGGCAATGLAGGLTTGWRRLEGP